MSYLDFDRKKNLKKIPPRPPIILTHVTGTNQFLALEEIVGARRLYDI